MKQHWYERLMMWICSKLGHVPGNTWEYEGTNADCKRCRCVYKVKETANKPRILLAQSTWAQINTVVKTVDSEGNIEDSRVRIEAHLIHGHIYDPILTYAEYMPGGVTQQDILQAVLGDGVFYTVPGLKEPT